MAGLNYGERNWLEAYRIELDRKYPNLIREITIFGSKARGDDRDDSDLDVLMVIRDGDWKLKWEIEGMGYDLAIGGSCVPTIHILTEREKEEGINRNSSFLESAMRDGVPV